MKGQIGIYLHKLLLLDNCEVFGTTRDETQTPYFHCDLTDYKNVSDIIDLIQKRFNDDLAYLAFITASIKISESPQFRSKFSKTYSKKCSAQLLTDSNQTINSVESRVRFLLRK